MQLSQAEPNRPLRPPRINGRYVVTSLLGKGAQARVYLAMDARLRQWRAIKVLAPEYVHDEQVRQRFQQEAEAMARLSHRNLLRILDIDTDGELPFIVMELARAGAVTDWLKRHEKMSPRLAIDVIGQACEGLAHAHAQNIVHRDVKPHNLLIADDGRILLTDFGIAQVGEESLTQTGNVLGTFAYMAPEQRNDTKSVDKRTDVYALGATLYTCLTLRTSAELFFAENRDEILDGIPREIALVILDACRYDRDERIGSVSELKQRLDECLESLEDEPSPPLNSEIMPVPDKPPAELPPDSGVEELARALAGPRPHSERHVPRTRAEMLFEEQSTTLYSDTGCDDEEEFAFVDDPETAATAVEASDPGVTQPSEIPEGMWEERLESEELTDVSSESSGSFDRTTQSYGFRRPSSFDQGVRRPFAELSEEDALSYVDASTLDRPTPAIEEAPSPRLDVLADQRRSPVIPPVLHTAEPASTRNHRRRASDRPSLLLYVGTAVLFLVTMVVSWSVLDKAWTSYQAHDAAQELLSKLQRHKQLVRDVGREAERAELERMWFHIEDALTESERNERAARFGRALVTIAAEQPLQALVRTRVKDVQFALERRDQTKRDADAARDSLLGRLTGPLGSFTY